jgi:hypothetical protein
MLVRQRDEFKAMGYQWFPDLGDQFKEEEDMLLAIYLLGGLIFGGYAQISGSDHLLQDTRSKLLLELTKPDEKQQWVKKRKRSFLVTSRP